MSAMEVFVVIYDSFNDDLYGMCTKVVFFFRRTKIHQGLALRPFVVVFFNDSYRFTPLLSLRPIILVVTLVAGICLFHYVFLW